MRPVRTVSIHDENLVSLKLRIRTDVGSEYDLSAVRRPGRISIRIAGARREVCQVGSVRIHDVDIIAIIKCDLCAVRGPRRMIVSIGRVSKACLVRSVRVHYIDIEISVPVG